MRAESGPADSGPVGDAGFDGSLPRSFLRPAMHIALLDGAWHGYELLEYVHRVGLSSVDLSGIYRTLRAMEHDRVVASEWEASGSGPPRRVYELTDAGLQSAESYLRAVATARRHLDDLLAVYLTPSEQAVGVNRVSS